jgi:tRNA-dihydrouridine synthase 1
VTAPARIVLPPHAFVLAPMVGGSELPFRLLARRHGAQLCYTPMIYSGRFVSDEAYRRAEMRTGAANVGEDAPLVVHFCGNCPDTLVAAARLAAPHCTAVDLNLGCPQRVAHSGNFGSCVIRFCFFLYTPPARIGFRPLARHFVFIRLAQQH